ncbi:MAG: T9SS type A sorting domain-containing protein [Saprospiraceae bacterium]|nr:T9SS type A sorting domain-containing protein [Saprospiraceae bacterium]
MGRFFVAVYLALNFSVAQGQEQVTWSADIACLVYTHCTPCHNDKGIAPFPLQSYEDAYRFRYGIEPIIASRQMPPWPPSTDYGDLAHERVLTQEEIDLFQHWVEQGAAEGIPDQAPTPPVYASSLEITDPDFSVRLPSFEIPDLREYDLYRCFVIPTNESEDRYITGIEIAPGNRKVVHHVILFQDTSGIPEQLDAADPNLGYTCFGGIGTNTASMVAGWVPGSSAFSAPEGMGIYLPKGATLVAQIHYPEGSAGEIDSTLINIKFSDQTALRRIENIPVLNHFLGIDRPLFIPANTRQTFHETFSPVPFKVIVTGIAPHAHLICESMKAYATTLTGDTIPLINIPHWDFDWQGFYEFKKPVIIPAFSTLHGEATYNNTTSNHHLPGDIPVDVSVGEATTDEMMLFFFSFAVYQQGDENLVIDNNQHTPHYNDCSYAGMTVATQDYAAGSPWKIWPNPASSFLHIETSTSADVVVIRLTDLWGRFILEERMTDNQRQINLPEGLPSGVYLCQISDQSGVRSAWKKVIISR